MNKKKRILVVDDTEVNRMLLTTLLESFGHETAKASSGAEALALLTEAAGGPNEFDIVLTDVMMPGMDGFEVTRRIRSEAAIAALPILVVTSLTGREDCLKAIESGANDFVSRPVETAELRIRTNSLLQLKESQDALRRQNEELEEVVKLRTLDLQKAMEEVEQAYKTVRSEHLESVERLALVAELRDQDTGDHVRRVGQLCAHIADLLKLPHTEAETLFHAAPLHDVGKIAIPDSILLKRGELTEEECAVMKQHTVIGAQILGGSKAPIFEVGKVIALSHHERWDGGGYPYGVSGDGIPLYGRICAVADVYDALSNSRPYKQAYSPNEVIRVMSDESGRHFDPEILSLFLEHLRADQLDLAA